VYETSLTGLAPIGFCEAFGKEWGDINVLVQGKKAVDEAKAEEDFAHAKRLGYKAN